MDSTEVSADQYFEYKGTLYKKLPNGEVWGKFEFIDWEAKRDHDARLYKEVAEKNAERAKLPWYKRLYVEKASVYGNSRILFHPRKEVWERCKQLEFPQCEKETGE